MEKITGNEPAMPTEVWGNQDQRMHGLTIRQHFAAMANAEDIENWAQKIREALAGYEMPNHNTDPLKYIQFLCDAEATFKTMKADALINSLNKPPTQQKP